MSSLELGRRFIRCIENRDIEGARACMHPDAEIWHNYDRRSQTVDENMQTAERIMSKSNSMKYNYKRMIETEDGYLQQHVLEVETLDGQKLEGEAIAYVIVRDGKIARIEEYLDPAQLSKLR